MMEEQFFFNFFKGFSKFHHSGFYQLFPSILLLMFFVCVSSRRVYLKHLNPQISVISSFKSKIKFLNFKFQVAEYEVISPS